MIIKCPYCGENAEIVTGDRIYPNIKELELNIFWLCDPCGAYVGCHNKNEKLGISAIEPKGTLANAELREMRKRAHYFFDPIWLSSSDRKTARIYLYKSLAEYMGIDVDKCHIGYFDIEQCKQVIEFTRFGKKHETEN